MADNKNTKNDAARAYLLERIGNARNRRGFASEVSSISRREGSFPLSYGQERLWFLEQANPGTALFNEAFLLMLKGPVDFLTLETALGQIFSRHDILRTRFITEDGEPRQIVDNDSRLEFIVNDELFDLGEPEKSEKLKEIALEEARKPFDLERAPLMRVKLFRLEADRAALFIANHHIISDALSRNLIAGELALNYRRLKRALPAKTVEVNAYQYRDFVTHQRKAAAQPACREKLDFWKEHLAGAERSELLLDFPRPAIEEFSGTQEEYFIAQDVRRRLEFLAKNENCTPFVVCCAAFAVLLHVHSGQNDVTFGFPSSGRNSVETENLAGFLVNTLPLRLKIDTETTFRELLRTVKQEVLLAFDNSNVPFEQIVQAVNPVRDLSTPPIFNSMLTLQPEAAIPSPDDDVSVTAVNLNPGIARLELTLEIMPKDDGYWLGMEYRTNLFRSETIRRFLRRFDRIISAATENPDEAIGEMNLLSAEEERLILNEWNQTDTPFPSGETIAGQFATQVAKTPGAIAVRASDGEVSWKDLNCRADFLAARLSENGIGRGSRVAIYLKRDSYLLSAILGILKTGAAYVPLDREFPVERIRYILQDCQANLVIVSPGSSESDFPNDCPVMIYPPAAEPTHTAGDDKPRYPPPTDSDTVYIMYTSGSTGRPKGVVVRHRNLVNFFTAMDSLLGEISGTWLAMTSYAFDISVLELLWTLCRGVTVMLPTETYPAAETAPEVDNAPLDFSLFFFSSDVNAEPENRYRLLMECAAFADENGFKAIWTPERHFHHFGGLFPNPSVISAALAAKTKSVMIRGGSVVVPLHHPVRVAEEWSVVDNISGGRAGIAFASGWHADDFVFSPDSFEERFKKMCEAVSIVRDLWSGNRRRFENGVGRQFEVEVFPPPVQKSLPFWITSSHSAHTFEVAGKMGGGVLTHLLGQNFESLGKKISHYRKTRKNAGYDEKGSVVLMLHTYVGTGSAETRELVRRPMKDYLATSLNLVENLARGMGFGGDIAQLGTEDIETILDVAFERYAEGSSLLGTIEECLTVIEQVRALGVTEIACLVDFGLAPEVVLEGLRRLSELKHAANSASPKTSGNTNPMIAAVNAGARHLQVTPSILRSLIETPEGCDAVSRLKTVVVGGEEFTPELGTRLKSLNKNVFNVYGPTETSVWSTGYKLTAPEREVLIGRPLANTKTYVLNAKGKLTAPGVPGELYIGGEGVTAGYLNQDELTKNSFLPDTFGSIPVAQLYRTGDWAAWTTEGSLRFLGRIDNQVKIRGFRIELGEIESIARQHPDIKECAACLWLDKDQDKRIAAYIVGWLGATPSVSELRSFFKQKVPGYMIPNYFVVLDTLPLTTSGKIDRAALPPPKEQTPPPKTASSRESDALTAEVAMVWAEVLSLATVSPDADFFELGGHSLLAVKLISRCRDKFGRNITLAEFFKNPTVFGMVSALNTQESEKTN